MTNSIQIVYVHISQHLKVTIYERPLSFVKPSSCNWHLTLWQIFSRVWTQFSLWLNGNRYQWSELEQFSAVMMKNDLGEASRDGCWTAVAEAAYFSQKLWRSRWLKHKILKTIFVSRELESRLIYLYFITNFPIILSYHHFLFICFMT